MKEVKGFGLSTKSAPSSQRPGRDTKDKWSEVINGIKSCTVRALGLGGVLDSIKQVHHLTAL